MYKIGTVIRTTLPYKSFGVDEKERWFVFLGRVNFTRSPRNIYLCTTTTQIQKYKENPSSTYVFFSEKNSCFDRDCILCLDEIEDSYTETEFNLKFKPEYKGEITKEKLREIAIKIKKADLPKIIIDDILESFKLEGISTK